MIRGEKSAKLSQREQTVHRVAGEKLDRVDARAPLRLPRDGVDRGDDNRTTRPALLHQRPDVAERRGVEVTVIVGEDEDVQAVVDGVFPLKRKPEPTPAPRGEDPSHDHECLTRSV